MINRIYINGRFLTQPITGVQRYGRELLNNFDILLENYHPNLEIHCLIPSKSNITIKWKNIIVDPIGINTGNMWEQFDLPLYLKGAFLFSPANTGPLLYRNQAVTMHDASVFAVPHSYSASFRIKHQLIFQILSRLAKIIFTDSEFSRKELSYYLNQPVASFHVIHLAGNHMNNINSDLRILEQYSLKKNEFILTVASQSPHKNLQTIKDATKYIKSTVKIVFAGGEYDKVFSKQTGLYNSEKTIFLGYINDRELKGLYNHALGYIFPSYYEGFGLPILEAQECGCPVLCSKMASLPEIAGEAALYFDPKNPIEIAGLIDEIGSNSKLRNDLILRGNAQARTFTWQKTANETLNLLIATIS